MSENGISAEIHRDNDTFDNAFNQAIALQQSEPKWLGPGETVVVHGQEKLYEFIGINEEGMAVCRMPNANRSKLDKFLGKNKFLEIHVPVDNVANAELTLGFYSMYRPDKGAEFYDLDSSK